MLIRLFIKTHFVLSFQYSIWIKNCSHGLRKLYFLRLYHKIYKQGNKEIRKKKIKNRINIINDHVQ